MARALIQGFEGSGGRNVGEHGQVQRFFTEPSSGYETSKIQELRSRIRRLVSLIRFDPASRACGLHRGRPMLSLRARARRLEDHVPP